MNQIIIELLLSILLVSVFILIMFTVVNIILNPRMSLKRLRSADSTIKVLKIIRWFAAIIVFIGFSFYFIYVSALYTHAMIEYYR